MANGKVVSMKKRHKKNRLYRSICLILSFLILVLFAKDSAIQDAPAYHMIQTAYAKGVSVDSIPKWSGKAYTEINQGKPSFSDKQKRKTKEYVKYSKLDKYNRPRAAIGCLGPKTLNNEDRAIISAVKPVGWHIKKYPSIITDRYVYNRCHLLMQAAAAGIKTDQCNSYKNLITGTRYLNVDGMLPYELKVHNYIEQTGNHVLYRVTPVYKGRELVARGVQMEAYSLEDKGKGVCFNVYCYNVQPGIRINYKTGNAKKKDDPSKEMLLALKNGADTIVASDSAGDSGTSSGVSTTYTGISDNSTADDAQDYVLNKNSKRIHYPWCDSVNHMKDKNKWHGHFSRSELIDYGYVPCGECNP